MPDSPRECPDDQTGAQVLQLTDDPSINHSFFFLNSSFRPGHPDELGFVTHRGGTPQPCLFNRTTGISICLSEREGIQPFSPAFSPDGRFLDYTTTGGEVWRLEVATLEEQRLASLDGAGLGECGPSPDGRFLVTACKRGPRHGLFVIDIEARSGEVVFERDLKIIHPQFHPGDPERIEFAGDPAPRLWLGWRDGSGVECLYDNTEKEFIVHESFLGTRDIMIFAVWPYRLGRLDLERREIETITEINAWHMASSPDGSKIVSDTNHPDRGLLLIDPESGEFKPLCAPDSSNSGSQWEKDQPAGPEVWASIRGAEGQTLSWMEMKSDSVYGPQWTHPHPAFDETGERVVYTSDRSGNPQVYVVDCPV